MGKQLFDRSSNTLAKLTIFGGLAILVAAVWFAYEMNRSPFFTRVDVSPEQPVPFSHKHHVQGLGIDCRYCHTSVETSSFAGIPPTKTCMNCHSVIWKDSPMLAPVRQSFRDNKPLEWTRVHNLPDFVYFNHSIHIAKGIGCTTCHGQVDDMPLMHKSASLYMQWCIHCHEHPERFVRPKDKVFDMSWHPPVNQIEQGKKLVKEYGIQKMIDCTDCHH